MVGALEEEEEDHIWGSIDDVVVEMMVINPVITMEEERAHVNVIGKGHHHCVIVLQFLQYLEG